MIPLRKYQHFLRNVKLRTTLFMYGENLKVFGSPFGENKIMSAVFRVFSSALIGVLIVFVSLFYNSLRDLYPATTRKVFYPLQNDNLNAFHETQDLILRKSDLEVPSKY